ncbi:MAG TPA: DUF5808 domain-containing protein [Jiangellaceae bacterium]|nr:DUF5808 domain-containing protein [Jiangellaceae bacterium]
MTLTILTVILTVAFVGGILLLLPRMARPTVPSGQPQPGIADRDDDAHWIGGLIYINRDDPALWVAKRFGGIGWTVNLGRPTGVVMVAAVVALAVGVPIWAAAAA